MAALASDAPPAVDGTVIAIDRPCPRCGALAGRRCVEVTYMRRRPKIAAITHIARGWLDRRCPTCKAPPGDTCRTPSGRDAAAPHAARLTHTNGTAGSSAVVTRAQ
ncbi:MAG: hypothetical protein WKF94_16340 [Solirubrobacteraceae bacterium]